MVPLAPRGESFCGRGHRAGWQSQQQHPGRLSQIAFPPEGAVQDVPRQFLGSKCQVSRTHSCSFPEPGGSEGLEIFPEEAFELGLQRGQLCALLSWHLETLSVLATFSFVGNTCEATDSLMEKQTSTGSDSLLTLLRVVASQMLMGVVVSVCGLATVGDGAKRPLALQDLSISDPALAPRSS